MPCNNIATVFYWFVWKITLTTAELSWNIREFKHSSTFKKWQGEKCSGLWANSGFNLVVIPPVLVISAKTLLVFTRIIYFLLVKSISINEWPLTNRVRVHKWTKIKVLVNNTLGTGFQWIKKVQKWVNNYNLF